MSGATPTPPDGKGTGTFRRRQATEPGRPADTAQLFDVSRTVATACAVPHCQAIRTAGQTGQVITCAHDLDPERKTRPRECLNRVDPATHPFPEGF